MNPKNIRIFNITSSLFFKLLLSILLLIVPFLSAQERGEISGSIIDKSTQQPLPGAKIVVFNISSGTASDSEGKFTISNISAGNYSMEFRYIGYKTQIKMDIIVRPDRIMFVNVELDETTIELEGVTVKTSFFYEDESTPVSAVILSYEEIRRVPDSVSDISRILNTIPGVSQQTDQFNDLMMLGGSPSENGYYVNNMPIPNINHFPVLGAAGGAIGILNTDLIQDVNFYTGGFSSVYGDRLSSIMHISYREGNRETVYLQLDLNFSGFGGQAERSISKPEFMI